MWQTNAQTDTTWRHRPHLYIASRGKNHDLTAFVSLIWMAFDLDLICTFKIKLEAESLLQQLWGPKNQSLWNNSCRPQSILTKFECTGQGATAFRNFWVRLAQWGKMGARMSSVQLGFLSPISDTILSTLYLMTDFRQIWPQHVNVFTSVNLSAETSSRRVWSRATTERWRRVSRPPLEAVFFADTRNVSK